MCDWFLPCCVVLLLLFRGGACQAESCEDVAVALHTPSELLGTCKGDLVREMDEQ